MIYLFAKVLSSQQLRPESSFYSVPSCAASYLQPNSERRKEGQSKAIEHREVCPLGGGGGGMCLESPSPGEKVHQLRREQIHGTRRERWYDVCFKMVLSQPFSQVSPGGQVELRTESFTSWVMVPWRGVIRMSGVSLLPEGV